MTVPSVHPQQHARPSRILAWVSLALIVAGWLAFAAALVASPAALDDVWRAVGDLPLVFELCVWIVAFPFMLALAIWRLSWPETARLIVIAVVASAYVFVFLPRKARA